MIFTKCDLPINTLYSILGEKKSFWSRAKGWIKEHKTEIIVGVFLLGCFLVAAPSAIAILAAVKAGTLTAGTIVAATSGVVFKAGAALQIGAIGADCLDSSEKHITVENIEQFTESSIQWIADQVKSL